MTALSLARKHIRLFFHYDLDGAIGASLIKLFSGAIIDDYIVCSRQDYEKPPKKNPLVLDVFVDCRSKNRDEDIRLDHHASGETAEYLGRAGITVDTKYLSAVTLVANALQVPVDKKILEEMDKVDGGEPNTYSDYLTDDLSLHKILFEPGLLASDYANADAFETKLKSFMVKGLSTAEIKAEPSAIEQHLKQLGVTIEEITTVRSSFMLVHTPENPQSFNMEGLALSTHLLPFLIDHYYAECAAKKKGVYVIIAHKARGSEFDALCRQVGAGNHPEPFQLFIARSKTDASLNVDELIATTKKITGITNGGGRDSVGGMNTASREKAITALKCILEYVRKNGP